VGVRGQAPGSGHHRALGRDGVNGLAPYVADSEDDQALPFIAGGWEGQIAPASLGDWQIVIDYPQRKVRIVRAGTVH